MAPSTALTDAIGWRCYGTYTKEVVAMTMDRAKGKGKEVIGTAKEKIGEANGDERLRDEGSADKLEGKGQGVVGKVKEKAGDLKRKVT
jgi:uncharacterized protein YjbJ (UPF0337 family)